MLVGAAERFVFAAGRAAGRGAHADAFQRAVLSLLVMPAAHYFAADLLIVVFHGMTSFRFA